MYLIRSYALNHIKDKIGQNNHFLITGLVGLDTILKSPEAIPTPQFSDWNPKSIKSSVERSRVYLLQTSFIWIIDCLDTYLKLLNRKPFYIEDSILAKELNHDEVSSQISAKVSRIESHLKKLPKVEISILHLALHWRNLIAHTDSNNGLDSKYVEILKSEQSYMKENFSGLILNDDLILPENTPVLKQKTVSAVIKCIHSIIYKIDEELTLNINLELYIYRILLYHFSENEIKMKSTWSRDAEKRSSRLKNILLNYGFKMEKPVDPSRIYITFEDERNFEKIINGLVEMSFSEVTSYLKTKTNWQNLHKKSF